MGSNIIAHLIFFSLHTFYMLILRACLVHVFKHMFLVFKQYYTYFHTLFYPYVFPKKKNWKLLFKHTYHCHTFGSSFNNTSLHFPISLSLSLSLSREYEHVQEARAAKKSLNWSSGSLQSCLSLGFFGSSSTQI